MISSIPKLLITLALITGSLFTHAESTHEESPFWIWKNTTADNEQANFKKVFTLKEQPKKALLLITCDDSFRLSVNGKQVASSMRWQKPLELDISAHLKAGENHLLVEAQNESSAAGLLFSLKVEGLAIVSDKSWQAQAHEGEWHDAVQLHPYGKGPWGDVMKKAAPKVANAQESKPAVSNVLNTLPGFKAEKIYTVKGEEGSWVGIASDPKGRLITTDQYGGVYRVTLTPEISIEKLPISVTGAHGALCAFDSLYLFVNEGDHKKRGLYRLRDTNGDDQYDQEEFIIPFNGGGEHGMHSIVLSPDKTALYLVTGNFGKIPSSVTHHRMSTKWGEDHLLPRMADGRGHNKGGLAPGGFIMKISPDGKSQEVINTGFRNEFDAAFNLDGELFTYDADMEYDIGSPWYRPTRINHVVSGADWGWRAGSGKWPSYYTDTLPAVVDIGPGSPTGVCNGLGAKFPAKYQKALYAADWTYGTMYAIHLEKDGASYRATKEEFVSGKPLPLTDQIIHTDGHMYFLSGGRRTTSGLYRLSYVAEEATEAVTAEPLTPEIALRREIEALHAEGGSAETVATALKHISSDDRFIRHAARTALERQSTGYWKSALKGNENTWAVIELTTALARMGERPDQDVILTALNGLDLKGASRAQLLAALRSYQLSFTRLGAPTEEGKQSVIQQLSPLYPHAEAHANRELAQLLLYLNAPAAVTKTVQLMLTATDTQEKILSDEILQRNDRYAASVRLAENFRPNSQQFALAFSLRSIKEGWTEADRSSYFSWFPRAKTWQAGNSFAPFLENTRKEALANVPDEALRKTYDKMSNKSLTPPRAITPPEGPRRAWTIEEAVSAVEGNLTGRDFSKGENLYHATSCATCHPFDGQGAINGIGPNLTGSANRYSVRDMMENIIDPSKVISDQYGSTHFQLKDGSSIIGRVGSIEEGVALVMTNPFSPDSTVEIALSEVSERKPYALSPMPAGLINSLNADELSNLIAFIFSAGDPEHAYFQQEKGEALFNGENLEGWKGKPAYWSVKDGTIYGSTIVNPTKGNTFLILESEPLENFHLSYEGLCSGNNSGVMYRSEIVDEENFTMKGYQADMHPKAPFLAMLYEEKGRGILIKRGEVMTIDAEGNKEVLSSSTPAEVDAAQWQKYEIIADGNRVIHMLNGEVAIDLTDDSPARIKKGYIGLQLHAGPEMETQYRNIQLKKLD